MQVGIIGDPGRIDNPNDLSTKEACERCGNNTGNLVFRYAVTNHIASPKHYFDWKSEPNLVREICDVLVFPAANQINPRYNWDKQADFIEKVNLPCVVVGLGAQAPELGEEINLQPGTLRWLKAIAERTNLIGVRGEFTANVLADLGINNTTVIGCPSNFINPLPNLGTIIENKLNTKHETIVINDSAGRERLRRVERKLIDWMRLHNGVYICQSPQNMIALAWRRFRDVEKEWLKKIHRYLLPDLSYEEFILFVAQYFRIFFDAKVWSEFLSSVDLSIGTRMHGNILAIQSSTPGICIYHDSRTKELCNTLMIPNLSEKEFLKARNLEELVSFTKFEGYAFDRNRIQLANKYKDILIDSGVELQDNLKMLTNSHEKLKLEV